MNDRNCRSCRWWWQDPAEDDIDLGQCRAGLPVMQGSTRILSFAEDAEQGVWPLTGGQDWCAHHAPTEKRTMMGDTRPGVATLEIQDNGIVTVTHFDGEQFELSALEGLTEADKKALERMVWVLAE